MAQGEKENKWGDVSPVRHKTMQHIKSKDTVIEKKLRKALWEKGYRYRKNVDTLDRKSVV
mgnify:CR=1 FL=1